MLQIVWRNPNEIPKVSRVALSRFGDVWTAFFRVMAFTSQTRYEMIRGGRYGCWRPRRAS